MPLHIWIFLFHHPSYSEHTSSWSSFMIFNITSATRSNREMFIFKSPNEFEIPETDGYLPWSHLVAWFIFFPDRSSSQHLFRRITNKNSIWFTVHQSGWLHCYPFCRCGKLFFGHVQMSLPSNPILNANFVKLTNASTPPSLIFQC